MGIIFRFFSSSPFSFVLTKHVQAKMLYILCFGCECYYYYWTINGCSPFRSTAIARAGTNRPPKNKVEKLKRKHSCLVLVASVPCARVYVCMAARAWFLASHKINISGKERKMKHRKKLNSSMPSFWWVIIKFAYTCRVVMLGLTKHKIFGSFAPLAQWYALSIDDAQRLLCRVCAPSRPHSLFFCKSTNRELRWHFSFQLCRSTKYR